MMIAIANPAVILISIFASWLIITIKFCIRFGWFVSYMRRQNWGCGAIAFKQEVCHGVLSNSKPPYLLENTRKETVNGCYSLERAQKLWCSEWHKETSKDTALNYYSIF